jgi:hypothetical protein
MDETCLASVYTYLTRRIFYFFRRMGFFLRDLGEWVVFFLTIGHPAVPGRRVWVGPTVFADGLGWVRPTGFDVGKMLCGRGGPCRLHAASGQSVCRVGANWSAVQHQARSSHQQLLKWKTGGCLPWTTGRQTTFCSLRWPIPGALFVRQSLLEVV